MPLTTVTERFTNPRDILIAVQRLLGAGLSDIFPSETIVISDPNEWENGIPEPQLMGPFICLALTDSDFPDDVQIGGGAAATEELAGIEVYIFSDESRLDQAGHMPAAVYDPNNGLLELKRRVLRVLAGADPTGDNNLHLLSQWISIRASSRPRKNDQGIWFLSITIGTSFFWDLT